MRPALLSTCSTVLLALSAQVPVRAAHPGPDPMSPPLRRLAPPMLDPVTGELRVAFEGLPPVYRVTRLAPPRRFVIDFDRAALVRPASGRVDGRTRWLRSWRLEQAPDGHARLVLHLSMLAPQHLLSARRGRMLVLGGTLFVPLSPPPSPTPAPVPSRRPAVPPVLPPKRPLPPPPAPTLAPTPAPVVEPNPEPVPTPEPTPQPVPELSPTPAPEPLDPVAWPAPRLTTELAWIDEHVAFEALRVAVSAVPHLQLDWCPSWAGWRLPVAVGAHAFQFASTDYPGVFHRREVTTGAIALVRDYELGPLRLATGLGWGGTWNRIISTSGPPAPPAASQFWFTPVLDLRGWGIRQEVVWTLGPDLTLGLDLAWTPVEDVTAAPGSGLPRMTGYRIAPVLAFGTGLAHRVGMFLESHVGGDFPTDPQGVSSGFATSRFGLTTSIGLGTVERSREGVSR